MRTARKLSLLLLACALSVPVWTQDITTGASAQQQPQQQHRQQEHPGQGRPRGQHGPHQPQQPIDTAGIVTMTREKNVYVINTTKLGYDFRGYRGPTPLEVRIYKDKIQSVKALHNNETPKYFEPVKTQMLPKFERRKVKDINVDDVDAVTGATFSSKAVRENIRLALEYYKKHKK